MKLMELSEILTALSEQKLVFTNSKKTTRGRWATSDAQWNYLDIPHLNHVHSQVESVTPVVDHSFTSSILMQRLGPIRFPLVVVLIANHGQSQIYFTCIGPFVLLIKSAWIETGQPNQSEVTTEYFLGSSKFLKVLHKFIHYILDKNFQVLMGEDIPMREQRGRLRELGYRFKHDLDGYSYLTSLKTGQNNVIDPELPETSICFEMSEIAETPVRVTCKQTHRELVAWKASDHLLIAPSICPHEGASLEGEQCTRKGVQCPWHGRVVGPIAEILLNEQSVNFVDSTWINNIQITENSVVLFLSERTSSRE